MTQALHTSSTGINAGQQQINVVANNVANINTVAYKSANATFETLFSNNLSYGSAATKTGGGTNPKQIGLGTKIGGITRNLTPGQFVQTGRDTDLMISGTGYFVVEDSDGTQYFTRDGIFSRDSEGNLVTQAGMKVVGAENIYSTEASSSTVKVPANIKAIIQGSSDLADKTVSDLNNSNISPGEVSIIILNEDGTRAGTADVTIDPDGTMGDLIAAFNDALAGSDVKMVDNKDGTISFECSNGKKIKFDQEKTTSNFLGQTGLSSSNYKSRELNQSVSLQDMLYANDKNAIMLDSLTVDENGIVVATYTNGATLTKYVDNNNTTQWKFRTPEGVVIKADDVTTGGTSFTDSNFVIELATMVNPDGLISINHNMWKWGQDVGEIYYGVAGELAFGKIESSGYEGSNVDIATELTNMITAQRMIQMNSRVFGAASEMLQTLSYLGS